MKRRAKLLTVIALLVPFGIMVTLTAYSVTLFQLFCRATGYGGTVQVATGPASKVLDRKITVRFNADVSAGLPWRFEPLQKSVTVRVGEQALAFYHARSRAERTIIGQAVFNVTPAKAGLYFDKVDCFCFSDQKLAAGAETDLPVQFFIDPEIAKDHNLDDVSTITLSYTFFETEKSKAVRAASLTAPNRKSGAARRAALN